MFGAVVAGSRAIQAREQFLRGQFKVCEALVRATQVQHAAASAVLLAMAQCQQRH